MPVPAPAAARVGLPTVLRLHAALDAETDAAGLLHRLPGIALELARADRAVLLLHRPGEAPLQIEAPAGGLDGAPAPTGELPAALLEAARHARGALRLAHGTSHAFLALPLRRGEAGAGVLVLERNHPKRAFTPARVAELELLAALASAALQRCHQREQQQHESLDRRRAEAGLRQAQRLEAVGTLASGVAHDFNNILGAILGFGESALRHTRAGSRLRRDLECIVIAGERGRALVERLLTFSRSGVNERMPVHVEREVREALALLQGSLPPLVSVHTALHAGTAALLGDATQVHQVVMNLAINALQAMPGGGTLRVSLRTARLDAARMATTGLLRPGEYLVLALADEGTGIPEPIRDRIFDPFFTTKEVGTGTGLGLSLVHGIVTELGGAVDLATTPGAGSTFTVYLPRSGDMPSPPQAPALPRT